MKSKSRKFLSLFLSVVMVIAVIPLGVITATAETSGDFEYSVLSEEEKTCKITKYNGEAAELDIPSQLDGYTVTGIGEQAFIECTSLISVTIPDGVTSIGQMAFVCCSSLTNIAIPNSVTSIEPGVFAMCSSLTNITIPNGVTNIGNQAFFQCTSIESITIGSGVAGIGQEVFLFCNTLQNIYVDSSNENYCDIDGVLFNKTATELICCPAGKSGDYTIPNSVTIIKDAAFALCASLSNITIPDSVTSIGEAAFEGCNSLKTLTIGNGVESISRDFPESLENIYIGSGNKNYCDIDGVLFNKAATELIYFPKGKSVSYVIPDSVTSIGDNAFGGCTLLTSVTIPDGVTDIGMLAFYGCTSLESVTIPDGVTNIGSFAFENCTSLTSITIPDSVTNIGTDAFAGCQSVTLYNKGNGFSSGFISNIGAETANVIISDGVTYIADKAFQDGSQIANITIPDSVTVIGNNAFSGCALLTSVTIPEGVTSIGEGAFANCTSLESIALPDSITRIGRAAFNGTAYYNTESNWENDVLYIGNHLIKARYDVAGEYSIKEGTKTIADYAFLGCEITSVIIVDGVTSIGEHAFSNCTSLESITIPQSVTSIGDWIFSGCGNLTIYGYSGSYAETYANENSIPFVALKSIVQFDKSQIRFHGVGADKDFSNYKDTFDVRTVAKISQEDFRNTFGTDEEAVKNITDIGFIYAAEKNVATFDLETAKAVAEGTGTDENYIKKSVSNIQHAGDGADYIFTCIVTDVPDADKEQKGYCFAYVCCNGTYYYFDDVTVMDFNALYTANKPQA